MNFVGLGIDVVEISRIKEEIEKQGSLWLSRVYSDEERALADSGRTKYRFFAGRYAGKEAIAKALGTGFAGAITWSNIEILRLESGAPTVRLSGEAHALGQKLRIAGWLISISYTPTIAFASVIALHQDSDLIPKPLSLD